MRIKRKSFFIVIAVIILLSIAGYFVLRLSDQFSFIAENEKHIGILMDLKEIDSEFIEEYNDSSQNKLDVLHYNIRIELLPETGTIKGDVTVTLKLNPYDSQNLILNFYDNLKINSVYLNDRPVKYSRSETNLSIIKGEFAADTSFVRIKYEGKPKSLGFGSFKFDDINGSKLIYTLNEPVFASTWFPCIDRPDDKALADIYITNDTSFVSLSNGRLKGISIDKDKRTYHWKLFYPISTYLIALYSGNYKTYSDKFISTAGDTVDLYCYALPDKFEEAVRDFSDHKKYLKVFEELFGYYPFPKEKYSIAQFNWVYGAMEHQTITGLGTDFISGRKLFQDMIIHELAHQWWGNAVGPATWRDIWLNEGFSTYSEALYWEKASGADALKTTLAAKFGTFRRGNLHNPDNHLFSSLVYDKGAWVLHMLRKETGDSTFFRILRNYYQRYKYKNASTEDFKKIAEEISGRNLKQFFDQWVFRGEGIIEAGYSYRVEKSDGKFKTIISIKQLQNGYDIYKFPVDIKFVFDNSEQIEKFNIKQKEEEFIIFTESEPREVIFDPDKWLLATFDLLK